MIAKTQEEIMRNWRTVDPPHVSIRCITYNHAPYIAQALDSFLEQETTFPFEIIVHDDASTDGTDEIVREYERKYPKIIKPIYEEENLYSRDWALLKKIIDGNCRGDYIALCEGDDYWCDSGKLQKQVDFLDSHPDFSACTHNTVMKIMDENREEVMFPKEDAVFSLKDYRKDYHTSSIVCRRPLLLDWPEFILQSPAPGDVKMDLLFKIAGSVYRFADVMSVYRFGVPGSWAKRVGLDKAKMLENKRNVLRYYEGVRDWAPEGCRKEIDNWIRVQTCGVMLWEGRMFEAKKKYPDLWKKMSAKKKLRMTLNAVAAYLKKK